MTDFCTCVDSEVENLSGGDVDCNACRDSSHNEEWNVVNRKGSCNSSQEDMVVVATGKDVD